MNTSRIYRIRWRDISELYQEYTRSYIPADACRLHYGVIIKLLVCMLNHISCDLSGFPAFYEKEIPSVFPDISLRKFQNSIRNTFSLRCVIFTKATMHKTHIRQTGENLSLLGHFPKFPDFPLIFGVFPKLPEIFLTGKLETHFQGFS